MRMDPMEALDNLKYRLEEGLANLADYIAMGTCEDHAQYKYQCGKSDGWKAVLADIEEIRQQYIDED